MIIEIYLAGYHIPSDEINSFSGMSLILSINFGAAYQVRKLRLEK